jgi:hypothetical protein
MIDVNKLFNLKYPKSKFDKPIIFTIKVKLNNIKRINTYFKKFIK